MPTIAARAASYTLDGTQINLFDNVGIQADSAAWVKEAEWTVNGARCVNKNVKPRFLLVASPVIPPCLAGAPSTTPVNATCGASFGSGTYLVNEIQSATTPWK